MGAHFSRASNMGLAIAWLVLPLLLLIRRLWVARVFQILLIIAGVIWIETTLRLVQIRQAMGESWMRLAIILAAVTLFTLLSALVFENKFLKQQFKKKRINRI